MLKYEAIASKMKALLDNGDYQSGDRLPNLEQLKETYEVSKSTIIKALEILEKEGYIYQSRGSGIFVRAPKREGYINLFTSNGFTDDLHTHQITSQVIEVKELVHPDATVMQYLHLNPHDKVYFVKRVRYIDNKILCIENAYFNQNLVVYMSEDIAKGSIFRYLENYLKINIGYSDIYFNIDTLNQDESELLKQPVGTPTLRYEQVVYTKTGIPFDYSQLIFHHENAKFYIPSIK